MDQEWRSTIQHIIATAIIVIITIVALLGLYVTSPAMFFRWHLAISVLGLAATLGLPISIALTKNNTRKS